MHLTTAAVSTYRLDLKVINNAFFTYPYYVLATNSHEPCLFVYVNLHVLKDTKIELDFYFYDYYDFSFWLFFFCTYI